MSGGGVAKSEEEKTIREHIERASHQDKFYTTQCHDQFRNLGVIKILTD